MQNNSQLNEGLPSFRFDSQNSECEFDAAETIENLRQILSSTQRDQVKVLSNSTGANIFDKLEKSQTKQHILNSDKNSETDIQKKFYH